MTMKVGQVVRFKKHSRYEGDFRKGDLGLIEQILAPHPLNQNDVYVISRLWQSHIVPHVWVTNEDIEVFDQLRLF